MLASFLPPRRISPYPLFYFFEFPTRGKLLTIKRRGGKFILQDSNGKFSLDIQLSGEGGNELRSPFWLKLHFGREKFSYDITLLASSTALYIIPMRSSFRMK